MDTSISARNVAAAFRGSGSTQTWLYRVQDNHFRQRARVFGLSISLGSTGSSLTRMVTLAP